MRELKIASALFPKVTSYTSQSLSTGLNWPPWSRVWQIASHRPNHSRRDSHSVEAICVRSARVARLPRLVHQCPHHNSKTPEKLVLPRLRGSASSNATALPPHRRE